ncbi:response regulator transcription factor [Carboxylicivirga marina]|uniref:Response regulator transcription factor n=1 Tax=Carboxylicivirga marina TaxID=2800988 RepID=A0ABS1HQ31_9BACT|nr:LuxR C-terminal-related transcriptional regulator [Carboxylicivirga marina]MBK3519783.1 response regulator transcription factor [Carboxylicivirga marina]
MVKVLIVENSHIIAIGLISYLRSFQEIEPIKVTSIEADCCKLVKEFEPEIILVNTSFIGHETMAKLMEAKREEALVIHVFNTSLPIDSPVNQISILESQDSMQGKLNEALKRIKSAQKEIVTEELSPREKAILKEVALGLTNKEIAEKTYISTHTVISHRKNITRKLGIKTVSGLTVYAILNNIIHVDDVS